MSFSSRVIAESAPPVSPLIKHLGLLMWTLPILLSAFCVVISPRGESIAGRNMVNVSAQMRIGSAIVELPELVEPVTFARVGTTPLIRTALTLPPTGEQRFPLAAEAWRATPFAAGKVALKIDHDQSPAIELPRSTPPIRLAERDIQLAAKVAPQQLGEARTFRRVKVLGATAIQADNFKIVLADVEPMPEGATCKRIDGVMQSCIERAEHRLAILLQARTVSCELSEALENGVHLGRCTADKIDIASDLLRQKLAQRRSSTVASIGL